LVLGAAGFICWICAGFVAHRLGSPLVRLAHVADEIGQGKLSSRARLGSHLAGEVGHLAHSINEMAERIERQMKGQRELLAGVSHEIRTPLSRLRVLTEILRDRNVDETSLVDIEREIEEIDDLTGQLLASSRLEFESLDSLPLDPVELTQRALTRSTLSPDLLEVRGTTRKVRGDVTLLSRALSNLIENAKHHGQGLEKLVVDFDTDKVHFRALDKGPGFEDGDLTKAFQSFFRGKGSGKGASSLGLGLSLVRRIAQAHEGDAFARNREEGGAEVTFTIDAPLIETASPRAT
jgi:signal transduction histidine kinase